MARAAATLALISGYLGIVSVGVAAAAAPITFSLDNRYATGFGPDAVAVADLDNDSDDDIVSANANANTVSVLLGNGAGGFGTKTDFAMHSVPLDVALGDLNGDLVPDVVTANLGSDDISVRLGTGTGGLAGPTSWSAAALGRSASAASTATPLTSPSPTRTMTPCRCCSGTGRVGSVRRSTSRRRVPHDVDLTDMNGDLKADLLIADASPGVPATGGVSVRLGDGPGSFGVRVFTAAGAEAWFVAAGDLNGDTALDVVVSDRDNEVRVLLGNGTGALGSPTAFSAPGPGESSCQTLTVTQTSMWSSPCSARGRSPCSLGTAQERCRRRPRSTSSIWPAETCCGQLQRRLVA